jgi:hypothetical protein
VAVTTDTTRSYHYKWKFQGKFPDGLDLLPPDDALVATVSGIAKEAGSWNVEFEVTDDANPQRKATKALQIIVQRRPNYFFISTYLSVLAAALLFASIYTGLTPQIRVLSCAISAAGFLLGVVVGILFSPFTGKEAESFKDYGKAMSALVTGYFISKAEDLIKAIFNPANLAANNAIGAIQLTLFAVGLLGAAIVVVYHRRYIADRSDVIDVAGDTSVKPNDKITGTKP